MKRQKLKDSKKGELKRGSWGSGGGGMGRHRSITVSKRKRGATESWHLVWPLVFPAPSWHLREPSDAPRGQQGSRKGGSGLFCTWWLPAALCLCFPGTPSISSPLFRKDLGDVNQQDEGGEGKGKRAKAEWSGGNGAGFWAQGFSTHMLPGLGQVV